MGRLKFMLRCTICSPRADIGRLLEQKMSKRLFTSAIVATLMMASVSIYSATQQHGSSNASVPAVIGG
jgi:hypothetical protein